jgi:hypothetical protein
MKSILKPVAWILFPLAMYLLQTWVLRFWIVDDAGISFAYARNLAQGHGLTAWPGTPPVEGFSNFLWTLILALLRVLHVFDPMVTPKITALICMIGSFYQVHRLSFLLTRSAWLGLGINLCLAVNAPLIIWTQSGLENALYIFLLFCLLHQLLNYTYTQRRGTAIYLSLICFLLALTRPEGCIYFFLFPLVLGLIKKNQTPRQTALMYYTLFFMLGLGGFLVFRLFYFHSLVPNTFYAKFYNQGDTGNWLEKAEYLGFAVGGRWGKYLVLVHILAYVHVWYINKTHRVQLGVLCLVWAFGLANFFVLPNDWMGELRFGLPFVIFFYTALGYQVYTYFQRYGYRGDLKKIISVIFIMGFVGYTGYHFHLRLEAFSKQPTVPFTLIKNTYVTRFNAINQQLHLQHASLLIPDVGASLYYSDLKIYDAAGLCDPTIAKKLGKNQEELMNYIFNQAQPTLIHLHGKWAELYKLTNDSRLNRDYVPLPPHLHPLPPDMDIPLPCEDYIRKDALEPKNKNF